MKYYTATLDLISNSYRAKSHVRETVINYRVNLFYKYSTSELEALARKGLAPIDNMSNEALLDECLSYNNYSEKEIYTALYKIINE